MTKFIITSLAMGFITVVTACQTMPSTINQSPSLISPNQQASIVTVQKPIMMCTMQYDPVCVKTVNNGVVSYQTFSNACMASNSMVKPVSVIKGACGADATR